MKLYSVIVETNDNFGKGGTELKYFVIKERDILEEVKNYYSCNPNYTGNVIELKLLGYVANQ